MSIKNETWQSQPIENEIITQLVKNRGEMLTTDLFRSLANIYTDFTRSNLMNVLFRLEVRGFIVVTPIKKDVAKVEIKRNGKFSDDVYREMKNVGAQTAR